MPEKRLKNMQGITMVSLVVTIIVLIILAGISITTLVGENGLITTTQQTRENITLVGEEQQQKLNELFFEMEQDGVYTEDTESAKKDEMIEILQEQIEDLKSQILELTKENEELQEEIADLNTQIDELNKQIEDLKEQLQEKDIEIADLKEQITDKQNQINNLQKQLDDLNSKLNQTTAAASHILKDYKAYSKGQLLTGTMANNGAVNATLNAGQSYTVPAGYHNGSGKVTANSLASQTQATATANNLSTGMTAWVNGQRITGNGTDVTNSYNNGYNAGYNAGYSQGVAAASQKTITLTFSGQIYNRNGYEWQNVTGLPVTITLNGNTATAGSGWLQGTITCTVE